MVEIEKSYRFQGPGGPATLADLFEGRRQLIVCHFMFKPEWEDGCPSCTAGADNVAEGTRRQLEMRDTTLAYVSRAPLEKLERYKAKRGWTFPWYSSFGSDFNLDFGVTSTGRSRRSLQLQDTRGARGGGHGLLLRGRAADRAAGPELLPARRRPRVPHVLVVRPRR